MPRRRRAKRRKREGGEDRLSALPDEVLQHVLSFLPSREAVRTCVLARRWRDQWKSVPALRITDVEEYASARKLNKFVNRLLRLRNRTPLHECVIYSYDYRRGYSGEAFRYIEMWVQYAISCQVQVLLVSAIDHGGQQLLLSNDIFISRHLKRLELWGVMLVAHSIDFSGCMALESLKMDSCRIDVEMILPQSLTCLTIMFCSFQLNTRTRICAPSVISLQLADNYGRTPLLESMPALVTAFIRLGEQNEDYYKDKGCGIESCVKHYGMDDDMESWDSVLLKGLTDATNLELIINPYVFVVRRDFRWCPAFNKLKTLLLNMSTDFSSLVYFLHHSPILEKLVLLQCETSKYMAEAAEAEGKYNPREQFFASKHLEVVEIKYCEEDIFQKCLQILSTYGIPSEKISIQRMSSCSAALFSFEEDEVSEDDDDDDSDQDEDDDSDDNDQDEDDDSDGTDQDITDESDDSDEDVTNDNDDTDQGEDDGNLIKKDDDGDGSDQDNDDDDSDQVDDEDEDLPS